MVCHRWTLALILICVPILATVISAFRVRLPGSSEVKPDLRKHKCESCDVSDLKLDPVLDSTKKKSAKSPYDDVKNILKEKRHLISEKLNKASYEVSESESESDDIDENEDKTTVGKNDIKHTLILKDDRETKTRIKKPSIVLDFSDDEDSDIDDDDNDVDEKSKVKIVVEQDLKKNEDALPRVALKVEKPKTKDKIGIESGESTYKKESSKIKFVSKEDLHKLPEKSKEDSSEEKILKTHATKDDKKFSDDHLKIIKSTSKERDQPKLEIKEKKKEIIAKDVKIVSHIDEDSINVKDKNKELERSNTKKEIKEKLVKKEDLIEKVLKEKKVEESTKIIPNSKERLSKDLEKDENSKEIVDDKKVGKKSDLKDSHILSDALHRKNLLQSEFEDFYSFFPTFAPNFSRIHNPECRRHGQILLRQLRGRKLWALSMLDATAKIPSGFLQGNGIQLGDFDQCLGVRARVQLDTGSVVKLQGKYCLAMIDIKAEHPELEIPVHLAQARNILKSRIDDPGHFVPRFSTLSWGVCVPSPCTSEDVEVVLRDAVKHYQYKTGITTRIRVNDHDCFTRKGGSWWKEWLEMPTVITLSFYAIIIILVLIATLQDFTARNSSDDDQNGKREDREEKEEDNNSKQSDGFLSSFSLYNTLSKLVAPASGDDIACIHGVRAVATLALLVAHKFLPIALTPYTNRIRLSEIVTSPLLSWCRAGWIFTDCFLMISGTLTSYKKSANDNVLTKLLSRYFRLTPALLAIVLFYAYVWDNISFGPMWGTLVWKNAELCREGWWWNILYVQNYFGFEDMCAGQTHHMALDFQLTFLGSILVWMIQSEVPFAGTVMPILHLLSAYSRYTTVRNHRLTLLVYQGVSVSQLYRTGRLSYMSISHRLSPYLIGLSLGLLLRNRSRPTKLLAFLGWFVCGTLWGLVYWAGYDAGYLDYRYDVTYAAQYAMLAPVAAASSCAWLIYAVHNGYSGIISRVLCSRPLLFISRISYALYLIQFVIYLTSTATTKTSKEFSLVTLIDLQEISTILVSSIILTVTLVLPLQTLPKLFGTINTGNSEDVLKSNNLQDKKETKFKTDTEDLLREAPPRRSLLAHREVLEEIPEVEVEYEIQRESNEGLEEILEEEEEEGMQDREEEEDLEVIEEEEGGEEDFWAEREQYTRSHSRNDNQDVDEWEWTANGNDKAGSQHYRFSR